MKHILKVTLLLISVTLVGCTLPSAQQDALSNESLIKETKSGYAEGVFNNMKPEAVRNRIIGSCVSGGLIVSDTSDNHVTCEEVSSMDLSFTKGWFSTTPYRVVRFVLYHYYENVKVVVYESVQFNSTYDYEIVELKGNQRRNILQRWLFDLGAE